MRLVRFFFWGVGSNKLNEDCNWKRGQRTSAMLAICCYRRIFPEEIQRGGKGDVHHGHGWRLERCDFPDGGFLHHVLFYYVKPGEKSWWFASFLQWTEGVVLQASKLFSVFFARISHMIPTCLIIEVEWYGLHHVCMKLNDMDWKLEHLPVFQVVTPDFFDVHPKMGREFSTYQSLNHSNWWAGRLSIRLCGDGHVSFDLPWRNHYSTSISFISMGLDAQIVASKI